jgi:hypothetical protein
MDGESDSRFSEPAGNDHTLLAADRELQPRLVSKPRMPPAPAVPIRLKVAASVGKRVSDTLGQFSLWWSLKNLAESVSDSPLFPRALEPALAGRSFLPLASKPVRTLGGTPHSQGAGGMSAPPRQTDAFAQPWPAESRFEPTSGAALALTVPAIQFGGGRWLPGPIPLRAFARRSAARASTPPLFPLPRFTGLFPEITCRHLAHAAAVAAGGNRAADMRSSPAQSFEALELPGEGIRYAGTRLLREKGTLALGAFVRSGPRWATPARSEPLRVLERERDLSACEYRTESMLRSHVPASGMQSRRDQ